VNAPWVGIRLTLASLALSVALVGCGGGSEKEGYSFEEANGVAGQIEKSITGEVERKMGVSGVVYALDSLDKGKNDRWIARYVSEGTEGVVFRNLGFDRICAAFWKSGGEVVYRWNAC
jgi:hypothetical protein